jgi:hypothetical protein
MPKAHILAGCIVLKIAYDLKVLYAEHINHFSPCGKYSLHNLWQTDILCKIQPILYQGLVYAIRQNQRELVAEQVRDA